MSGQVAVFVTDGHLPSGALVCASVSAFVESKDYRSHLALNSK